MSGIFSKETDSRPTTVDAAEWGFCLTYSMCQSYTLSMSNYSEIPKHITHPPNDSSK